MGIIRVSLARSGWLALAVLVMAIIACLAVGSPAARAAESLEQTILDVQPLAPVDLGATVSVTAQLTTATGSPLVGETTVLAVDGVPYARATTDASGGVSFTIAGYLVAGRHALAVTFDGTDTLAPSNSHVSLEIVPATIEVQTVPPMAGIEFSLDGHPFASDSDGVARYTVTRTGRYRLELVSTSTSAPNTRSVFARWGDRVFVPYREVSVPSNTRFRVGFNVSYLTNFTFVDAANQPVPPSRITSMIVRSPHRQVFTFDRVQPEWLPATTVFQDGKGLKTIPIKYSVEEVMVDGVLVVDRGKQQFEIAAPSAPRIALKLYSVRFTGHDAFYGFSLGDGAFLQHSDGFVEYQPFDANDVATFTGLPIATYRAGVVGGPGMPRSAVFDLVPGQTVRLPVITYLDIATVMGIGGSLALIMFVSLPGRLRRRAWRMRPGLASALQPKRRHPYAARVGYAGLACLIALGFVLTQNQAPGFGDPAHGASAATVTLGRSNTPTNGAAAPEPSSRPAPAEPAAPRTEPLEAAPIFTNVWRRNGGSATFGAARGDSFEEVDPVTGLQRTIQYFERVRLEYHPELEGTPYQFQLGLLGLEEATLRHLTNSPPFRPRTENTVHDTPDCEYFAPTGHQLCGLFRVYWHSHGLKLGDADTISFRESLALLGYPISDEFTDPDTGLTIQYFERARLEYHPEQAGTDDEVIAGTLNVESP